MCTYVMQRVELLFNCFVPCQLLIEFRGLFIVEARGLSWSAALQPRASFKHAVKNSRPHCEVKF